MQNLKILNSKEIKVILKKLQEQYGFNKKLDYVFLQGKDSKIYLINKEINKIDYSRLRINQLGLYFGKIEHNIIRVSIEGSQLIGKDSNKNILTVTDKEAKSWLMGEDIKINKEYPGFVIIKNKSDFLGSGKIKNNTLLNYVPKDRRIKD